ncbi:MAG TPA: type II methionyl aminopeptidase [Candidatus Thermoplasmatota archaeon]|nr:type II methionyl aminopeptidase [Candidatus Thermoplasmatota archaeon]
MDATVREKYLKAGRVAGRARDYGATLLVEGAKLVDVATEVEAFIVREGASPAFPCCTSLNEDAAHYTAAPGDASTLKRGDVVKLDVGAQVDGYIGDTATTVEVGGTGKWDTLLEASRASLAKVVPMVKPGLAIREIGETVESTMHALGFRPIANLTGHSVDHYHQHAGISIPSVPSGRGSLPAGIAIAIEPFATNGAGQVRDAQGGNIYHFLAARPQRDPLARKALAYIEEHHPHLPFAGRWIAKAVPEAKLAYALRLLERSGAVKQYPVLREAGQGMVAQFEHTVLVEESGVVVTTRGAEP